jgi:hypothetical protein
MNIVECLNHSLLPLVFAEGLMVICFQQIYVQYRLRIHEGIAARVRIDNWTLVVFSLLHDCIV